MRKFYRSVNSILRVDGKSNDMVMLKLLEAHSIPILTYAIEVVTVLNRDENRSLRVAYNSIFRKIFGYRYSESVTALQNFLEKPTREQLLEGRRKKFRQRLQVGSQNTLAFVLVQ